MAVYMDYCFYQQYIRENNIIKTSKVEALRTEKEITVILWYDIEKGFYEKLFSEPNCSDEVWSFARELCKDTANLYTQLDLKSNIVDLIK